LGKRISGLGTNFSNIKLDWKIKLNSLIEEFNKANSKIKELENERNQRIQQGIQLIDISKTAQAKIEELNAKRAQALKDLGDATAECGKILSAAGVKDAQNFQKETPISSFEYATNFISSTGKGVTKLVDGYKKELAEQKTANEKQKTELDKLKEELDKLRKEQETLIKTKDAELKQKDEQIENLKAQNAEENLELQQARQIKILTNETRIKQLEEENKKLNTRKNQETIKANNAEINRLRGENSKLRNEIDKLQKKIDEMKKNQVTLVEVKTEIEVISLD
jgi:DNA repair exonuclease SbcCD ATPase subunit